MFLEERRRIGSIETNASSTACNRGSMSGENNDTVYCNSAVINGAIPSTSASTTPISPVFPATPMSESTPITRSRFNVARLYNFRNNQQPSTKRRQQQQGAVNDDEHEPLVATTSADAEVVSGYAMGAQHRRNDAIHNAFINGSDEIV